MKFSSVRSLSSMCYFLRLSLLSCCSAVEILCSNSSLCELVSSLSRSSASSWDMCSSSIILNGISSSSKDCFSGWLFFYRAVVFWEGRVKSICFKSFEWKSFLFFGKCWELSSDVLSSVYVVGVFLFFVFKLNLVVSSSRLLRDLDWLESHPPPDDPRCPPLFKKKLLSFLWILRKKYQSFTLKQTCSAFTTFSRVNLDLPYLCTNLASHL